MSTLLWVLAVMDLIGGFIIGIEIDSFIVGITVGVVGFAILGGFASVVELLKEISSNTSEIKMTLTHLSETENRPKSLTELERVVIGTKRLSPNIDKVTSDNDIDEVSKQSKQTIETEKWDGINPKGEKAVYLLPAYRDDYGTCPRCGATQPKGRHVCWKCCVPLMYDEE